jgi:uncharacterized membrane protein YccC
MPDRGPLGPDLVFAALGLVIGAGIGALFTLAHRSVPLLVIGLVAIGCLIAGMRLLSLRRLPAVAATVGVVAAIAVLGLRGPGGSVVIQDDALGWTWQLGAVAIAAVALAWPRITRVREDTMEQ